jgi:hypothetical protein
LFGAKRYAKLDAAGVGEVPLPADKDTTKSDAETPEKKL